MYCASRRLTTLVGLDVLAAQGSQVTSHGVAAAAQASSLETCSKLLNLQFIAADFLAPELAKHGYEGSFWQKPCSPAEQYGYSPDGTSIFWRRARFQQVSPSQGRLDQVPHQHCSCTSPGSACGLGMLLWSHLSAGLLLLLCRACVCCQEGPERQARHAAGSPS